MLFAAALLHDVGKLECTRVAEDGSITSRHHARRGEVLTRKILWTENESAVAPFGIREQVCGLVRAHGLPLWFMEKETPERRMIQTSLSARLSQVALLAEADVRGRLCAHQPELLRRIELYLDYARELHCYEHPRAFASAHARFVYFHSRQSNPWNAFLSGSRARSGRCWGRSERVGSSVQDFLIGFTLPS